MGTKPERFSPRPQCGLCGKTRALTKTACCNQWICNDERKYVLFSYAHNSCHRNHRRLTLCGYHHAEGHTGSWKECSLCRRGIETEMYVWYGTNKYNFEKLEYPQTYEPTKCSRCGTVIVLSEGGYSVRGAEYWCANCSVREMEGVPRRTTASSRRRSGGQAAGKATRPRRARRG